MDRAFWRERRVFVTGHTGFKGGWLCAWLLDGGARVDGYALAPANPDALMGDPLAQRGMRSTIADIRDRAALTRALAAARPEVVFHLAAQPLVRASYAAPIATYDVNVTGTVDVLAAVRTLQEPCAVVAVTSDKCYAASTAERRHVETDALGGDDPYSASKACAEHVVAGCRPMMLDAGAGVATARAGNVIGGGDAAVDRLVPDLIRAFAAGAVAPIRRPSDVRPWQHVLDPLDGYLRLAEALATDTRRFSQAWNFGPPAGHEVPVATLADMAVAHWGNAARWAPAGGTHPAERAVLRLDSSKAEALLGWQPRVSLQDAIAWTIDWYRDRSGGAHVGDLMRRDIARYEGLAA